MSVYNLADHDNMFSYQVDSEIDLIWLIALLQLSFKWLSVNKKVSFNFWQTSFEEWNTKTGQKQWVEWNRRKKNEREKLPFWQ